MEALLKIMAFLVNDLIEPRDVLPSEKAKLAHRAYRIRRFAGRTSALLPFGWLCPPTCRLVMPTYLILPMNDQSERDPTETPRWTSIHLPSVHVALRMHVKALV